MTILLTREEQITDDREKPATNIAVNFDLISLSNQESLEKPEESTS